MGRCTPPVLYRRQLQIWRNSFYTAIPFSHRTIAGYNEVIVKIVVDENRCACLQL